MANAEFRLHERMEEQLVANDQAYDANQLELMNAVCEGVVEHGGACDEAAFVCAFFGGDSTGDNFTSVPKPTLEMRAVNTARGMRFAAGEMFMFGDSTGLSYLKDYNLYMVLPKFGADDSSASSVSFSIERSDNPDGYFGKASLDCLQLNVKSSPSTEIYLRQFAVAALVRSPDYPSSMLIIDELADGDVIFGMPTIRRSLDKRPQLLPGTGVQSIEKVSTRLMQHYVELMTVPQTA